MASLKDFHGAIERCFCTNPAEPMDCKNCLCRGYVAKCLACDGKGQTRVPVAGTNTGDMASTCNSCGGCGTFPANAPVVTEEALQTA